jgi:hypothetical protein
MSSFASFFCVLVSSREVNLRPSRKEREGLSLTYGNREKGYKSFTISGSERP